MCRNSKSCIKSEDTCNNKKQIVPSSDNSEFMTDNPKKNKQHNNTIPKKTAEQGEAQAHHRQQHKDNQHINRTKDKTRLLGCEAGSV